MYEAVKIYDNLYGQNLLLETWGAIDFLNIELVRERSNERHTWWLDKVA